MEKLIQTFSLEAKMELLQRVQMLKLVHQTRILENKERLQRVFQFEKLDQEEKKHYVDLFETEIKTAQMEISRCDEVIEILKNARAS